MDQGPLVIEEIDAGAELAREFDKYEHVKAAFWIKATDDTNRYLYIASDQINDTNFTLAYREVLRLAGRLRSPYLDPFRVKVINAEAPLAKAAVEIHDRFPGSTAIRFGGKSFGGISAEDVYIYPTPLPAAVS